MRWWRRRAGQHGGIQGNKILIGYDQEPQILNQCVTGGDHAATSDMTSGIMQSPLEIRPDLSFAPQLAEEMPKVVSENPFVLEYKLKKGLKWSDGQPLTSADAKWTFEQIMNPNNQILTRTGWDKVEKFETPDAQTVRMTFKEPYAPWKTLLGGTCTQIFPKHVYEGKDFNKDLNNVIVGSGPFKLKEWKKGQSLTLVRNDNYWGKKPALDEVTFRFIPDTNSMITALQSGEVSFIDPPPDIGLTDRLKSFQGVKVETKAGTVWEHIGFNTEKVNNLKIRQAIAYGINRQQVVDEILKGQVKPLNSVLVPDQAPYYTPAWQQYNYDPNKAKQLVNEAKAEGASTTITFSTTSGNKLRETLQQVVQRQLKDIGLDVKIQNTAAQTLFSQWLPEGNYEMGDWAWLANPDPSLTTLFSADQIPGGENKEGQNYYRYKNEEVTRWLKESDATVDENKRAQLLKQVQDQMAKDLPLIPMYQRPVTYAFSQKLSGPQVNPTLAGPFWNIGDWSVSQ